MLLLLSSSTAVNNNNKTAKYSAAYMQAVGVPSTFLSDTEIRVKKDNNKEEENDSTKSEMLNEWSFENELKEIVLHLFSSETFMTILMEYFSLHTTTTTNNNDSASLLLVLYKIASSAIETEYRSPCTVARLPRAASTYPCLHQARQRRAAGTV